MEDWKTKWQEKTRGGDEVVSVFQNADKKWAFYVVVRDKEGRLDGETVKADGTAYDGELSDNDLLPVRRDPPLVACLRRMVEIVKRMDPDLDECGLGRELENAVIFLAAHDAEAK